MINNSFLTSLTLSDAEADSQGGEDKTEDRNEDGERGPEPEAGQHVGEAAARPWSSPEAVQGYEVVDLGRRTSVVVSGHLNEYHNQV